MATDPSLLNVINRVLDVVDGLEDKAFENLKRLRPLTPKQFLQELDIEPTT